MSLFLGKIHYWLFNKIVWFEGLEKEIIDLAKKEGIDIEKLSNVINGEFGESLPNLPLENIIDKNNIHGWLQERIHSAEGRIATWTKEILKNGDNFSKLENVYITQGMKAAKEALEKGVEAGTAIDIFNSMNDYILDGMPCDRVNEILISEENEVKWIRRVCVHKDIWEKAGVEVKNFYILRGLWVKAFVTELNSNFQYVENEDGSMEIKKV
ncbi:hypothetical protein [Clostridium septicum]|uniref:Uncharacterized protein n=1 Tax=Clostridium septicum TaxID=1504 RepID=A0A9N7PHZ0_CLOSE|nr:hypothetical protein [Clostridium septicum]AYE33210.1 hypothetical protein CP523_01415 [Clostridium septicum]MDU1314403.1 hypothetical protein [Clostridium septicum]QAS61382.1 hypothetical protein EI377_11935 [Clostridium septicum]UEC22187.1 hypothetical protein LK444_07465 [Clostridium septicum]USR99783.1 hypothetical protein NH397_09720 [Clostridium septicum]